MTTVLARALPRPAPPPAAGRAAMLNARFADAAPAEVLAAVAAEFRGRIALLSSFGAEAAAPLHLLSVTVPEVPVLFLETGKHFGQTAPYRDALLKRLGLANLRVLKAEPEAVAAADPRGDLWKTSTDRCCAVRKVAPMAAALRAYDLLITGRKRVHGADRATLPLFEEIDGSLRLNLLAGWDADALDAYLALHDLPRHPLVEQGFASIGCWPCTKPATRGRDGRWEGQTKTECGIHLPAAVVAARAGA